MSFGRNIQTTLGFEFFSFHVGLLVVKLFISQTAYRK